MTPGGRFQVTYIYVPSACLEPGPGPRWLCLVEERKMPKRLNKSLNPEARTSVRGRKSPREGWEPVERGQKDIGEKLKEPVLGRVDCGNGSLNMAETILI